DSGKRDRSSTARAGESRFDGNNNEVGVQAGRQDANRQAGRKSRRRVYIRAVTLMLCGETARPSSRALSRYAESVTGCLPAGGSLSIVQFFVCPVLLSRIFFITREG